MKTDELRKRLEDEFPQIYDRILINGKWGIGKTYFIQEEFFKGKEISYISLFGINNFYELKYQLLNELDKVGAFLDKSTKNLAGNGVGIGPVSLPIPYFEKDIVKALKKKSKKGDIIIVIDDIERKNEDISIESVLGLIETVSRIENINIILIANEEEIPAGDKEKYESFKEKVIQKTYFVDCYSDVALESVISGLKLDCKDDLKKSLMEGLKLFFQIHQVMNLRTVEKTIKFLSYIFSKLCINSLKDIDLYDICIASSAIVTEKIEFKYSKNEKTYKEDELSIEAMVVKKYGGLAKCIVEKYFNESIMASVKYEIIIPLLEIFEDKNVSDNIKKINDYYAYKAIENEEHNNLNVENLFYLSEENQKKVINSFYENSVLKVNSNLDINSWFKNLNTIYDYGSVSVIQDIMKEEEIVNAMDLYIKNINVEKGLFYILFEHMPFEFRNDKMKKYNSILNEKITNRYYEKALEMAEESVNKKEYKVDNLERAFSIYEEKDFKRKKSIIDKINKDGYFIPNLNYDISEKSWGFAHKIWSEMRNLKNSRDNSFEVFVNKMLTDNTTTDVGKYRIRSLNSQYEIDVNEN